MFACILIVIILSTAILLYKYIQTKNTAILGSVLARVYLILAISLRLFYNVNVEMVHAGILVVLISDVINAIVDFFSKKYRTIRTIQYLEEAFEKLEHKYYTVLETLPVGIYVFDLKGKIEYVNKHLLKLTGYSKEELIGKNVLSFVKEITNKDLNKRIEDTLINSGDSYSRDLILVTKSGKEKLVKIICTRTENGHSTITGNIVEE